MAYAGWTTGSDLLAYTEAINYRKPPRATQYFGATRLIFVQAPNLPSDRGDWRRCHSDEMPVVPWRETHAVQVLQNLISNAVKYRTRGQPPQSIRRGERELVLAIWVAITESESTPLSRANLRYV